ncbi:hypothetical protein WMY93_020558 [Mugilogobius chulae]|uniref:G-protein coupled receptors family 1 profile domain-containing protein n=1 Tax=Mugilogobius chulae TaxID=88201 RepID=A0AAW0NKG6_9GOBI
MWSGLNSDFVLHSGNNTQQKVLELHTTTQEVQIHTYVRERGRERGGQREGEREEIFADMEEDQCYYNETIAFFYNRSGKYLATDWNAVSRLVMGLGITVCIFIMLANLLVMVAIYVNRRFHFPIYYLMANLAAADFFGLIDTSLTASVANLLAIAIERHITVFRMQLHTRMSNRRVVVVIVIIWTMSIVMGAIPSVGWNCICSLRSCSNMAPLYSNSYLVFWAVFNLVTFVVMVTLYAHIFVYVRQRTMRMSGTARVRGGTGTP